MIRAVHAPSKAISISLAERLKQCDKNSPLIQPVDRSARSHHRGMSRTHRSGHGMSTRSERASGWYPVLRSTKRLAVRRKVGITGTWGYERWSRGTGSTDELRWCTGRRTERTRPGSIVRRSRAIRRRWEAGGIRRRSGTRCRGTAWCGRRGVLRRRRTWRWTLIRRCSGWTAGAAGKWTRPLETGIARRTARAIVRT
jgi:hypothetical protein